MASTTTKRRSKRKTSRSSSPSLVPRERKKEVLGLMLMVMSALVVLALVSYTPQDEYIAQTFSVDRALDPGENRAQNLLGLLGATLAYWLVPRFIGYFSVALGVVAFAWGYVTLRRKKVVFLPFVSLLATTGAILLAAFFGWMATTWESDLALWSGAWGMSISEWMARIFGTVGSGIIMLLLLAVLALLSIDHDIQRTIDRIEEFGKSIMTSIRDRFASWREAHLEAQEERRANREERRQEEAGDERRAVRTEQSGPPPVRVSSTINDRYRREAESPSAPADAPVPALRREVVPPTMPPSGHSVEVQVQEQVEAARGDLSDRRNDDVPEELPYRFPEVALLEEADHSRPRVDYNEIEENNQILLDKLATYNIEITNINAIVGPTVTMYELTPAPGVKISRITALENDLAMAMAARGIRIIAPIPGKSAVGVEIPNRHRELVRVRDIISTARFQDAKMELPVAIGKAIDGEVAVEDLTRMPHLLIAGATGSGKSVGLNTLIVGLLYACHPRDLKFVMIDPKKIELQQYSHIIDHYVAMPPHSEDPIITDFAEALGVLKSCEKEMELRYDLLADAGVRSIRDYNKRVDSGRLDAGLGHRHLPYIVVIVDELADLMMTAGKDIEGPIARLAQMARAVGIHLVLATQRPSVDVITGLIKANFPSRIAYQVASKVDSRTILDQNGAEGLVGNGDLLYMNGSHLVRLQGPFVSVEEVEEVTRFVGEQDGPGPYMLPSIEEDASTGREMDVLEDTDELFDEAARIIVRSQQGSVSLLQRKLSVGYTRAARIVDQLEDAGVVGPFEGSKARRVLFESEIELDAFLESRKASQ